MLVDAVEAIDEGSYAQSSQGVLYLFFVCNLHFIIFMCTKLMQIYQKRTPTFLAEITTLVATVILLAQTHSPACLIE